MVTLLLIWELQGVSAVAIVSCHGRATERITKSCKRGRRRIWLAAFQTDCLVISPRQWG
jgi:hypothetical protein